MSSNHGGAKVGVRVAGLVSQSIVSTHTQLLRIKHKLAMAVFHSMSDEISEEVHLTLGPILRDFAQRYPEQGQLRGMLDFISKEHGQWQAITGTALSSSGLLGAIATVMNNELAPLVYGAVGDNPHLIPDVGTIAGMAAANVRDPNQALSDIASLGFNGTWATNLIELAKTVESGSEVIEMVRRGIVTIEGAMYLLQRAGMDIGTAQRYIQLMHTPLATADAALALLRGNMSQADAETAAAAAGINATDFEVLVNNTGEPLGLMELLEARRRGFIDDDRLTRGIIQSRVRNEWVDVAKAIAFSPMSTADAVNAVVQNHLTSAQGSVIASQNGLEDGAFDILQQTAGEPLSRTEMEELYNRGLATEDDVKQALAESRLKNKYSEMAFELHVKLLPVTALAEAVQFGAMTQEAAIAEAMRNGYSQTDATTLVTSSISRKMLKYTNEVVTAVETQYIDNALTLDEATSVVTGLGYTQQEATLIFRAAEYKRVAKITLAAQNAIRSKYLARHLTSTEASGLLDSLGTPANNRDQLLKLWAVEQQANVKTFTDAEILKYNKAGQLAPGEALSRLQESGHTLDDATIMLGGASLQLQLSQGTGGLQPPSTG